MRPPVLSLEDDLRVAVRASVLSSDLKEGVTADAALLSATGALPLWNLRRWEQVVRDELALAHQPSSTKREGWLDLANGNGHVRERVLRTLASPAPNPFFFALAARRLNDWVPQVRSAARETIPMLARTSDPGHVADALYVLLATWTTWGRLEDPDKDVLAELVSIDDVATRLVDSIASAAMGPAATVFAQALRSAALDKHLNRVATKAVQPSVRATAHRTLLQRKAIWLKSREWKWTDVRYCQGRMQNIFGERAVDSAPDLATALDLALADHSSIVRRVAAHALVREVDSLGNAALPWAHRLTTDKYPSIAERGAFVIQRIAAANQATACGRDA